MLDGKEISETFLKSKEALIVYFAKVPVTCLKVDFNNITDSDNPVARVCLHNTPFFAALSVPSTALFIHLA